MYSLTVFFATLILISFRRIDQTVDLYVIIYFNQADDTIEYRRLMRMDHATFQYILGRLEGRIRKQTTRMRKPISPGVRLATFLRFLATGRHLDSSLRQFSNREKLDKLF